MGTKYWAIDYVDDLYCELVIENQLYATEEAAEAARAQLTRPEFYEVTWYSIPDLIEVFDTEVYIDDKLKVHPVE